MVYSIIGCGGIGIYYGGLLAKAGKEVNFLFHTDYEWVKTHGLQVDSCDGDYHLDHVNAFSDVRDMPQSDVVIVALKTTQNHLLPSLLLPLLKPSTLVLLIQNGIGVEADLQVLLPEAHLAAGLAFICSSRVGRGHIHHQHYGALTIAPYSFKDEVALQSIVEDMQRAQIQVKVNPNYLQARWRKAVWNIPFNGLTVIMNASTKELMDDPSTFALLQDLMMETIGAANAIDPDVNIPASFAQAMVDSTLTMPPYSPSMRLDWDNHRPMELQYLYAHAIADAKAARFSMPKTEMLLSQLRFMEDRFNKTSR